MTTTRALSTRRVGDALRGLNISLKQAGAAAAAMSPGQIVPVKTEDILKIPLPQVTKVIWKTSGTSTLTLPASANERIVVTGDCLEDVEELTLSGPSVIRFRIANNPGEEQFEAILKDSNPAPGQYAATVTIDGGRTATLLDACVIEKGEERAGFLELGELMPNFAPEDTKFLAALIVTAGEPDQFYFTDPWNHVVESLKAQPLKREEVQRENPLWLAQIEQFLANVYQRSEVIFLKIIVPKAADLPEDQEFATKFKKSERLLGFQFVARSTHDDSEDRLTFTVMTTTGK